MTDATAATPEVLATRRRRPDPPGLYEPVGWVLVRAPLLPVEAYRRLATGERRDGPPTDPLTRSAIAVASRDLLPALDSGDARAARRVERRRSAVLRYLIRMSIRPTPYGLFAGVGLAAGDDVTDLRITAATPGTRARPDMEWLLEFVRRLEDRPDARRQLRVVANPSVQLHGERAFLAEPAGIGGGDGRPLSIRATAAVRRALALARRPVRWAALAEELTESPGATPDRVDALLEELWRLTFLYSALRPPLTSADPAGHVADGLEGVPAAARERAELQRVRAAAATWDRLPMEERPQALGSLQALAEAAVPGFTGTAAQVDAALPLAGGVHRAVAEEAARAAELLLRLGPPGGGRGQLGSYRHAFIERYGGDREVPLLELIDPDHGLGPPGVRGPVDAGVDRARVTRRDQALRALAVDALRERRLSVALEPSDVAALDVSAPTADTAPVSLDIAVMVLARSAAAIDAGDFRLLVGPNLGGQEAGRNLGRFGDLLGDAGRTALAQAAAAGPGSAADVPVELVYLPRRTRSANVVVRPAVHHYEVAVDTAPGVPAERAIPLSEILIGIRDGRFVARWPGVEGELRPRAGHMLNAHGAPAPVRFLEDLARDGRMLLGPFDWGPAADLPFLPRVTCGRTVLAPAQWRIDAATRDRGLAGALAGAEVAEALARWRAAWMVPRHVYLTVADNRLLLDLEVPEQAAQLTDELRELDGGAVVLLQEPLPGPEHAWLRGPDGGHLSELVVPVALRVTAQEPAGGGATTARPTAHTAASARDRVRLPGGDWLFLKLYAPRSAEDELLAGPVRALCRLALGGGLADGAFFVRYSDPDAHLRLRFRGDPARVTAELFPAVCDWGAERVAEGLCTRFAFDTYERELERYGGPAAMDVAEAVFAADSAMVVELLSLERRGEALPDRTGLAVLTVDALLEGLGLDAAARLRWYGEQVVDRRRSSDDFRARQRELRRLLGDVAPATPGARALSSALAARGRALRRAGDALRALHRAGALETPLERLCESFVHLHCNRLCGSGPPAEAHVLGLLLRAHESLARAPLSAAGTGVRA